MLRQTLFGDEISCFKVTNRWQISPKIAICVLMSSSIRKQSSSGTQMCIKTLASPLFNPTSPYTLPTIMCLEATSPSFITQCPATCELCSQWLPNHSNSCPRKGVHPSQWNLAPSVDVSEFDDYEDSLDNSSDEEI
ncbi:hypothetical protein NQZ79_g7602 [Umbelopsis isabellina]|nr:hypothetical protein NQZ79_g7602 [Umbelopsis isabellina]